MSDRKRLESEIAKLREQLSEIDAADRREKNAPLVGKCFRYRNSYGGDVEKWWLYLKVLAVDEDGHLNCLTFETTSVGIVNIEPRTKYYGLSGDYRSIEAAEFDHAWRELLMSLRALSDQQGETR